MLIANYINIYFLNVKGDGGSVCAEGASIIALFGIVSRKIIRR